MVSTPKNPRLNFNRGSTSGSALSISRPQNRTASLFDAEKAASRNLSQFNPQQYRTRQSLASSLDDALTVARSGESTTSDFTNKVTGKSKLKGEDKNTKGAFRRFGPLGIIIGLLFGGGAFFMMTFSLLGPQLSSVITEATDVQFPSYNLRNQRLLKYMMGDVKVSNFTRKYTNFSPWLKSRLAKNGIEVGKLDASGNFVSGSTISTSSTVLKYGDDIISANDFQARFASDANFRDAYYKAKRGRVAGFFDDAADKFYTKKGQTRDIFSKYTSTDDNQRDRSNFEDVVNKNTVGTDATVRSGNKVHDNETGEDKAVKNGSDISTARVAGDTPEVKARAFVNSISGVVDTAGVPICSALRVVNIASVAAMAYQLAQSANYFLSFLEPINKAIAGDGDEASAHEALNFLNESQSTEVTYIDANGVQQTKTFVGSPLESTGGRLIMSNTAVSPSDADPFGINALTRSAKNVAISTGVSTTTCTGVTAASALLTVASLATPGGAAAKITITLVAKVVGGLILTGVVSMILEAIIPQLSKMFISNAFEYYTGIPAGDYLFEGAASSNYSLATQSSASMPASKARLARQNYETALALAQEAEVDRINHSPFDASNTNTFLGSLVRQFSSVTVSTSLLSGFSAFSSAVRNSFGSILNNTYADNLDTIAYTSVTQDCEFLPGAVCDIYGIPIPASDFSTIDIAPDDATYEAIISQNLDFNGSVTNKSNTASAGSNATTDGGWLYTKYNLSDGQMHGLIAVAEQENGVSLNGVKTELSFMANLYEQKMSAPYSADGLVNYVLNGNWFASSSTSKYDENYTPKYSGSIEAARNIFINGHRTIPKQIIEHDCIDCGDITSASNDGVSFDVSDRSKYKKGKTVIQNRYGSTYVFYQWADSETGKGDPFGYAASNTPDEQVINTKASESEVSNVSKTFSDYKIRDGSNLANFITFCVNRESPWGVTDANILNAMQTNDTLLNSVPVANDLLDLINAYEDQSNMRWATGEICMNSEDNPDWDREFKYYQRYVEDMRILGTMSNESDNANPVLAYENAYDEAHPIDTSFEGTLARISGLTKDDVAFLMEVIDYSNELAQYDPTTRYGYVHEEEQNYETPEKSTFDTIGDFVAIYQNSYAFAETKQTETTC